MYSEHVPPNQANVPSENIPSKDIGAPDLPEARLNRSPRNRAAGAGRLAASVVNRAIALPGQVRRCATQARTRILQCKSVPRTEWGKRIVNFKEERPLESLAMIAGVAFITGLLVRVWRFK